MSFDKYRRRGRIYPSPSDRSASQVLMLFNLKPPFTTSMEERERCYSFFLLWTQHGTFFQPIILFDKWLLNDFIIHLDLLSIELLYETFDFSSWSEFIPDWKLFILKGNMLYLGRSNKITPYNPLGTHKDNLYLITYQIRFWLYILPRALDMGII
jgi:hypothetical protein